jgi:hypothetical protein
MTVEKSPPLTFPGNAEYHFMNKDNGPGSVIVVPPAELRTLRETVYINQARLDKLEQEFATMKINCKTLMENQSIYNNQLQGINNKLDDYRQACEAMFNKMLKK